MSLIDEYTCKCLRLRVARQLTSTDVLLVLSEAIVEEGVPSYIRSDNGSEFIAHQVQQWFVRQKHQDDLYRSGQSLATERSDLSTSDSENHKRSHQIVLCPFSRGVFKP